MSALLDLAARCEQVTGPDYSLDCAIWDAVYPGDRDERFRKLTEEGPYKGRLGPADKDGYIKPRVAFTASIAAAMTLVSEDYGHCGFDRNLAGDILSPSHVTTQAFVDGGAQDFSQFHRAEAATPALALCGAALRARAAQGCRK